MLIRGTLMLMLSWASMAANAMQPGEALAPWTLLDQYDQPFTLTPQTRVLLVARSMAAARLVNEALDAKPSGFLEGRHIAYIADIEHMPAIARTFAIPAMKSARYRILLDSEGRVAPRYNGAREGVQWLELNNGALATERQFSDAGQLRQALERLAD